MRNTVERYYSHIPSLEAARDESAILGREYYKTTTGFSFVMRDGDITRSVTVHRGYLTNGYSLPHLARKLLQEWLGFGHPAIVLHDWLSEYLLIENNYTGQPITIYEALNIFIKALEISRLTPAQVRAIYIICTMANMIKNPYQAQHFPYKRYVEDKRYGHCG